MEHSTADESDVAVADLPSTSGAHWANRDRDALQRRTGGRQTPFRRPPAVNSFDSGPAGEAEAEPDPSGSWDAFAPTGAGDPDAARASGTADAGPGSFDVFAPAQPGGAAPATGSGRASFGVTGGPISGARPEPVSPAAPHPAALHPAAPLPAAPLPAPVRPPSTAGDVPAFADLRADGDTGFADLRVDRSPGLDDLRADPAPGSGAARTDGDMPGGIGDFIGGPGRDIRPHRVGDTPAQPVERRRSRLATAATVLLSTVVLLGGAVAGVAFFAGEDESLTSVLRLGSDGSGGKVATAPLDGRGKASFELIAATTKVTLRTQDLGDRLFRITSAGDSGTAPSPVVSGDRVQLLLSPDGEGASGNVEVLLSTKVTWGLRFVGGTDEQVVDLTGGKISSIDIAGGSRRVDLRLSQPTGTVPVRVTGAVDELSVLSPAGSPVRVKVASGAKTIAAGDKTLRDVEPGSTLTPKDWKVANRYDVDAASRVTLLTVRNAS